MEKWAEQIAVLLSAAEEAAKNFQKILEDFAIRAVDVEDFQKELAALNTEPRFRRRKKARERTRILERRFMVEIKCCKRLQPYRRVYKPP